jgi:hypothetical protein
MSCSTTVAAAERDISLCLYSRVGCQKGNKQMWEIYQVHNTMICEHLVQYYIYYDCFVHPGLISTVQQQQQQQQLRSVNEPYQVLCIVVTPIIGSPALIDYSPSRLFPPTPEIGLTSSSNEAQKSLKNAMVCFLLI